MMRRCAARVARDLRGADARQDPDNGVKVEKSRDGAGGVERRVMAKVEEYTAKEEVVCAFID